MKRLDQRGQATVLVLGLSLVTFAVAGLAVDGTRAFLLRRTLQNAADAAAVAAASEIDTSAYYSSAGRTVVLDLERATEQVATTLGSRAVVARPSVDVSRSGVSVVLRGAVRTTFLGTVGIRRVPIAVEARAEPIVGSVP